jgi:hypothetical protein
MNEKVLKQLEVVHKGILNFESAIKDSLDANIAEMQARDRNTFAKNKATEIEKSLNIEKEKLFDLLRS